MLGDIELGPVDGGAAGDHARGSHAPRRRATSRSGRVLSHREAAIAAALKDIGSYKVIPRCGPTAPGPWYIRNIIANEACERFCWYGLRAVLILYLTGPLGYSDEMGVTLFSFVSAIGYFMPLVGGVVADSWLGRYKTILYFIVVYLCGTATLAITSIDAWRWGAVVGLLLIGVGMGGIKPCVSAFGADQFHAEQLPGGRGGSTAGGAAGRGDAAAAVDGDYVAHTDVDAGDARTGGAAAGPTGAAGAAGAAGADPDPTVAAGDDGGDSISPAEAKVLAVESAVTSYFNLFYVSINTGSIFSYVLTPLLRQYLGFPFAFGAPFVLLLCSVYFFTAARKHYVCLPPSGSVLARVWNISLYAVQERRRLGKDGLRRLGDDGLGMAGDGAAGGLNARNGGGGGGGLASRMDGADDALDGDGDGDGAGAGDDDHMGSFVGGGGAVMATSASDAAGDAAGAGGSNARGGPRSSGGGDGDGGAEPHWLDAARGRFAADDIEDCKGFWAVMPVFAVLVAFWMCFDQQGSSWTLQARDMNTHGLPPEQMGFLNAVFVLMLVPFADRVAFPALTRAARRGGRWRLLHPTPLRRIGWGIALTSLSFVIAGMVQAAVEASQPHTVSLAWQIPQYFVITAAEVLVSVTGLEFAYSQAAASMKGSIMAMFLLTSSVGDLLTGVLYNALSFMGKAGIFYAFAVVVLGFLAVYLRVAGNYRYRDSANQAVMAHERAQDAAAGVGVRGRGGSNDMSRGLTH